MTAPTSNRQAVATRRCPGCARGCTRLVPVQGWQDGHETLLCKRCASGLFLDRGRIMGLKLMPEARP